MVKSSYPFGVCIKDKLLLIVESTTICFLEQKNGKVISVDDFIKILIIIYSYKNNMLI